MKKKLALLVEGPYAEGIRHSAVVAYVGLPSAPVPSAVSRDVSESELGSERIGEANWDMGPEVGLDLGTEQACWGRLWVDLVQF